MRPGGAVEELPGTPEHQRLLRGIAAHYAGDDRVRAVSVFGSLGRGTWDEHSDLDLDVVTVDGLTLDAVAEVRRLCEALGERPVVVVPDRKDAADVVLTSLMQLSIRYHPLQSTKINIVDSLIVLAGRIERDAIVSAGLANARRLQPTPDDLVSACVRHAASVDACLHRRRLWTGYLVLHQAREQLLRLFALGQGAIQPYHAFDAAAGETLHQQVARTVPAGDLPSLQRALLALLDLLESDLPKLSDGRATLTPEQRQMVALLRARQSVDGPDRMLPSPERGLPA